MAGYTNNNNTTEFKQADAFLNVSVVLTNKAGETKEVSLPKGIPLFQDSVVGKKLIELSQDKDWTPALVGGVFIKGSNADSLDDWS